MTRDWGKCTKASCKGFGVKVFEPETQCAQCGAVVRVEKRAKVGLTPGQVDMLTDFLENRALRGDAGEAILAFSALRMVAFMRHERFPETLAEWRALQLGESHVG
jgi:hypothetical protein